MSVYTNEDRFSMTAERYLTKHHVLLYMEDSIAQLLESREENPRLNPIKILSDYFTALRDGNHTMFREYQFIRLTPHNRASFVKLFWKCYKQIGKKGDLLSIQEYHALITLLCSDFPFEIVQKTARIILLDDALDCLISFSDFIYAFQVQFYYEEFLDKCLEIYQSMMQTHSSPRNPVVVPSGTDDTKIHANHLPGDGVDAMQYFRAVYPLCDRMSYSSAIPKIVRAIPVTLLLVSAFTLVKILHERPFLVNYYSTPPAEALKEILFNVPRISFYGFLMAIAKSDAINEHIGRLPPKAELLEGPDTEFTPYETPVEDMSRQIYEDRKSLGVSGSKNSLAKKRSNGSSKPKTSPDITVTDINNSNPTPAVPKIQGQPVQPVQPRSRSVSRSRAPSRGQGQQSSVNTARTSRKKVISSDESTDDTDDDDDDSDDDT